jgi:hypothetical protein
MAALGDVMRVRSLDDLPLALRAQVAQQLGGQAQQPPAAKPRKYRNEPVVVDGIRFDSKLEARYYEQLKLRRAAGEVLWFLRQPCFVLEGGVRYRADFLVVLAAGGVEVVDCKGFVTEACANKLKQVRARYGFEVKLWPSK